MEKKSWSVVDLPIAHDLRGNLTVVEGTRQVPFDIARVYYLYDVPSGSERAGHAHRQLQQLVIAASGSFSVLLDDGRTRETVFLNRSHLGVLMGPMVWRVINNFSSGAVCLVLASRHYEEADYIRDYDTFRVAATERWRQAG
ncbi:sugar 3,4-ketoisomerase [Ferrovibrio xuzhouensis]|uniref:FdtA/QdtA family cupin domain-containing protein n=1 Tax=Ferrovibrio xuzhouensis TaxID=1576914 RepID=A0ABV7VHN6_9PROT